MVRACWTVSRLPDPTPSILCRVEDAAVRERTLPNDDNASTPDDWADSSEDFGERRERERRGDARHHNLVSERAEVAGGRGRETRNQDFGI